MIFFLLTAVLIADGGGAQTSEDSCDPHELKVCVDETPRTQVGLPRNKEELDKHCLAYQTGMSWMDTWIKRFLPTDGQKLVQQQIGGARALMRYLCSNDTALRRDGGGAQTSEDSCDPHELKVCVDETPRTQVGLPRNKEELDKHCLAYQTGMSWMDTWIKRFLPTDGQKLVQQQIGGARALMRYLCSNDTALRRAAGALLQRMAWVLAQDVVACSRSGELPRAPCAAPRSPRLSVLLSLLYYIYFI